MQVTKHKQHHLQDSQEVSPFPTVTTRLQETDITVWQRQTQTTKKDTQKKYSFGTVSQ